jgi:hypothetical protein
MKVFVLIWLTLDHFSCRGIRASYTFSFLEVVVGCEIAENQSTSEHTVDDIDSKGKKKIYLHLKKFFRGTRFTFQPFLKSLEQKHKEGEIVCVSGKVSFLELLALFFDVVDWSCLQFPLYGSIVRVIS